MNNVAIGEFGDFEKIKTLSKEHDIVINAGNSFTGDPVTAIAAGLRERPSDSKGKLIHISGMLDEFKAFDPFRCVHEQRMLTSTPGAGNFIDFGTSGQFNPESKVWSDASEDDIKLINDKMFNGPSDTV